MKRRGQKPRLPRRQSSVLVFWSISTSDLWDIAGLQGDKNGNTRPRQPGAKDAHGKLQGLPQGCSVTWRIGLAWWANLQWSGNGSLGTR